MAARRYSIAGGVQSGAVSSSYKTAIALVSATTIRPEVVSILCGALGTPADNALSWLIQRFTSPGTGTSVTPSKQNPSDPSSSATAAKAHSSEPTYTAGELPYPLVPLHQKNTVIWQADSGKGIILPATANNGLGIQVLSAAYTNDVSAGMVYED